MTDRRNCIAFILASTDHGTMIVNRFDYKETTPGNAYGVGYQLLKHSAYQRPEMNLVIRLLDMRRRHFGDGIQLLDIGANIGAFTIAWSKHMAGWGNVVAIEAQERIYYALAGNIAINNCFNARAIYAVAAAQCGVARVPVPNYEMPGSFGSLELRPNAEVEDIGQPIAYQDEKLIDVAAISVDSLKPQRMDVIKVDVERMELDVLQGARRTIDAHHPILIVEKVKTDSSMLRSFLDGLHYKYFTAGMNLVAIHPSDPCIAIGREPTRPAT